jgi:spermidine synthase
MAQGDRSRSLSMQLRVWAVLTLLLSLGLYLLGQSLRRSDSLAFYDRPATDILVWTAAGLALFVPVVLVVSRFAFGRRVPAALESAVERTAHRPYWTMAIISFVALFVELMLIRYSASQIRIFSFYKNVPLIACFLGLGLGCTMARGRARHAMLFLLWLVPLAAFLSAGSLGVSGALGKYAALGSSEHVLGDFLPENDSESRRWIAQAVMASFSTATLAVVTFLFALLGRLLGDAFERVERLPGYTVNILGSLAGILLFVGVSYLQTPPWLWFVVGLAPLLWWMPGGRAAAGAIVLILASAAAVMPSYGDTVWSPYQKLVGHWVQFGPGGNQTSRAYLVEISDVFYQVAVDRRPQTLRRLGNDVGGHYDEVYRRVPRPGRVLVVGAGTGNDVAAALRFGADHVDAVDIDPAIVEMGRANHPEQPYADPRVRVVVDDARHAFRVLPQRAYDLVVFGLLDSHTQLGMSSVRLDNYVFTLESFAEAARLVRPGGHLVVTAAGVKDWFQDRFARMLRTVTGDEVATYRHGLWVTYSARVGPDGPRPFERSSVLDLPTDDWPFLYLPSRGVPSAYLWVVGCLALASVLLLRVGGLRLGRFGPHHGHLFFLGAAFLLMEVHAINRLALLFGTTWFVSAITIAIVLLLIVGANFTVLLAGGVPYGVSYGLLGLSLALSFWVDPDLVLGAGTVAQLGFGALILSPVYFAGLVFARSFRAAADPAPAMGANIMGAVLGGWIEYATMAFGMRALVLFAALFYAASLGLLWINRRR